MIKPASFIKTTLIASLMAIYSVTAFAQDVPVTQPATASTEPPAAQYDAQYEDSGVKVYISKVFPRYQMKEGQMVATQGFFTQSVLKTAGIPIDSHRIFHSVSDETAELNFTTVLVGTKNQIKVTLAHENTNKVVGAIGAVAMFAISRGMSASGSNSIANLSGLRTVVGTGMLKSADFEDVKIETSNNQVIQAEEDDIICISQMGLGHDQNDKPQGSSDFELTTIYFVLPSSMKGEAISGNNIISPFQTGEHFKGIMTRAILKSANLVPAAKI